MDKKVKNPEVIARSKTRSGLQTSVWNYLVKGYTTDNHWYKENSYWCCKMILKQSAINNQK